MRAHCWGHLFPDGPINVDSRHTAPTFCTRLLREEEGLHDVVIPPALFLKKDPGRLE